MLTCGNTAVEVIPLPATHWLGRLVELHARTLGTVAASNALDKDQPMVASVKDALATAEASFTGIYTREHEAATRYVAMVEADEKRTADHETAVRVAVESGEAPPAAADVDLVRQIIDGAKQSRIDAWPVVEQASKDYIGAAKRAAATRACLLAQHLRPIVESYQPTIDALHAAESRASVADVDGVSLVKQFKAEGLLR